MSNIMIAYATGEGQTAKICGALAQQLETAGHNVTLLDLESDNTAPVVGSFDAVIVAASVHAGKHQKSVAHFVTDNREALRARLTAFLSVSLAATATEESGRNRANEQVNAFLEQVDWQPDMIETLAGAFRYSEFSGFRRWIFNLSQKLFRKELDKQGWPELTADQEFTDWEQLRRFGNEFSSRL